MSRGKSAFFCGLILIAVSLAVGEYLEARAVDAVKNGLTDGISSENFDPTAGIAKFARLGRYMDYARAGLAAGVLTTLVGVVFLLRDRFSRRSQPSPVSSEEVQALRDEIATLKKELDAARAGQS